MAMILLASSPGTGKGHAIVMLQADQVLNQDLDLTVSQKVGTKPGLDTWIV